MKITCCVMGCERWTRKFPAGCQMICREHWRHIPRSYRRVWKRIEKQEADMTPRAKRIWRHMKNIAFERSAGL